MNNITIVRVLPVAITAVALSGVAAAASAATRSSGYTACANSKHQLAVSHHGKCAKHFHKVTVGARGATEPSDVYVATGSVAVSGPTVSRQSQISPAPAVLLSLPAGSYLVTWQVHYSGRVTEPGSPAGKALTASVSCEPVTSKDGIGTNDMVQAALVADEYDGTTSFFDFAEPLSSFWALKVPAGGTKITMSCPQPYITDSSGAPLSAESTLVTGQIEATRTGLIHGSDNGSF